MRNERQLDVQDGERLAVRAADVSLARFIPDLPALASIPFRVTVMWAHHDACHYFKPYDEVLPRLYGTAESAADYRLERPSAGRRPASGDVRSGQSPHVGHHQRLVTMEAQCLLAQRGMADLRLVSQADGQLVLHQAGCEPLHVQMNLPDRTVSVINNRLTAQPDLIISTVS